MGDVDAVGLLGLDPAVVIHTIVELPGIGLLVDFGREDARDLMLHDLKHGRGMNDHVVDSIASGGIAASRSGGGGGVDGYGGVETARGNGDDLHIVEELNIVVDVALVIHHHAGDATLNELVGVGVHEQDSALIGDFGIVQSNGGIIDIADDISRAYGFSLNLSRSSSASVLGKSVILIQ